MQTNEAGSEVSHQPLQASFQIAEGNFDFRMKGVALPVTAAGVLDRTGFEPPSSFLLFEVDGQNLREFDLEEAVHPRSDGSSRYIAFRSDRSLRFELNDDRTSWGRDWIAGADLCALAGKSVDTHEAVQMLNDGSERVIEPQEAASLSGAGVERFFVRPRRVTVDVDGSDRQVLPGEYRVADFKRDVGVPAVKQLDQVVSGQLTPLSDDQVITINGGEKFVSHERRGGSS